MRGLDITDEILIVAIRDNDYISYNKLFVRYYSRLCLYVYSILMDKNDAEDVVQELFLHLWNNRKKIEIEENVSRYLYTMAKNLTLNHLRSQTNYRNLLEKQEKGLPYYEENTLESDEYRIALYDCINLLPVRSREVLLMHRIKGFKQKEIADKLNITVKTIKNQIWASLQKLRKCLELKGI